MDERIKLSNAVYAVARRIIESNGNQEPISAGDADLAAHIVKTFAVALTGKDPVKVMGAPGDWGYDTPIGDALLAVLKAPPTALELVAAERARQIAKEGYDAAHDDRHTDGEILRAALAYGRSSLGHSHREASASMWWPWGVSDFKPSETDPICNLVKAGALILAEIERLQRAQAKAQAKGGEGESHG